MPNYSIDAAAATARRVEDKAKVDKFIEEGPDFARVNQVMQRELRRTATQYAWKEAIRARQPDPLSWPCVWMGCVDSSRLVEWSWTARGRLVMVKSTLNRK